jgi:hypothetical protein
VDSTLSHTLNHDDHFQYLPDGELLWLPQLGADNSYARPFLEPGFHVAFLVGAELASLVIYLPWDAPSMSRHRLPEKEGRMPLSRTFATLYKSDGIVEAPPTLDRVLMSRWPDPGAGPRIDLLWVTLLGDTGQQIALLPGDYVHFAGRWIGSEFEADQWPLHLNPYRLKFFADRVVSMSRPPPPGAKIQPSTPAVCGRAR